VKIVAARSSAKKPRTYTVTVSSAENVYDEQQLFRSIFESLYAISQDSAEAPIVSAPEEHERSSIA